MLFPKNKQKKDLEGKGKREEGGALVVIREERFDGCHRRRARVSAQ
jgi:hypothetical protein